MLNNKRTEGKADKNQWSWQFTVKLSRNGDKLDWSKNTLKRLRRYATHPLLLYSISATVAESCGRAGPLVFGGSAYGLGSGSAPSAALADWQRELMSQHRTSTHTTCKQHVLKAYIRDDLSLRSVDSTCLCREECNLHPRGVATDRYNVDMYI